MEKFKKVFIARFFKAGILMSICLFVPILSNAQKTNFSVGAYYFDGWTGVYPYHITKLLTDSFSEREPKWGWVTSTQKIVDEQIQLAANAGLSFFSFCWYYQHGIKTKEEPLNHALNYYLASKDKEKLKFCLMVANHGGAEIGPEEWPDVMEEMILLFKDQQYQSVDNKPLLVFFSGSSLIRKFGSPEAVKTAFAQLRSKAIENGLKGVSIAINVPFNEKAMELAKDCGFDILTGYNYPSVGFQNRNGKIAVPIDSLQQGEHREWDKIVGKCTLPYIPVVTLNWDPRPWANARNGYDKAPFYTGLSEKSVYNSMNGALKWMNRNKLHTTNERMILVYAWNENGEGAYLTPSKNGDNFLKGLKKAIFSNSSN